MKRKGTTLSRVEGKNNKEEKIIRYEVMVSKEDRKGGKKQGER
jgi:hypothetical protein